MVRSLCTIAVGVALLVASLTSSVHADVAYPTGTQDFESMSVGADLNTLSPWFTVNQPGTSPYTVVAADDVLGTPTTRGSSTRWLRVSDLDATNVQNRFYSGNINPPAVENYTWRFFVNLETTPPGGSDTKPKFVIQHDNAGFANAWGIEFTSTGANLTVLGIGGTAASTPLYPLSGATAVGQWVEIVLFVSFSANTVTASANGGAPVSLPINLTGTANERLFRFCFRGEGLGNSGTMLLDDVKVTATQPAPAIGPWGLLALATSLFCVGALVISRARRVA